MDAPTPDNIRPGNPIIRPTTHTHTHTQPPQKTYQVKHFGASNFSPSQLQLLQAALEKQKMSLTTVRR